MRTSLPSGPLTLGLLSAVAVAMVASTCGAEELKPVRIWQGDYPLSAVKLLPADVRNRAVGYIADAKTFEEVWRAYTPEWEDSKKVVQKDPQPKVDFKRQLVLFKRNLETGKYPYVNSFPRPAVDVRDGKVDFRSSETRTAVRITDHVKMVLLVVPRQDGMRQLYVGKDESQKDQFVDIPPP
jgi:hypothetical protein